MAGQVTIEVNAEGRVQSGNLRELQTHTLYKVTNHDGECKFVVFLAHPSHNKNSGIKTGMSMHVLTEQPDAAKLEQFKWGPIVSDSISMGGGRKVESDWFERSLAKLIKNARIESVTPDEAERFGQWYDALWLKEHKERRLDTQGIVQDRLQESFPAEAYTDLELVLQGRLSSHVANVVSQRQGGAPARP